MGRWLLSLCVCVCDCACMCTQLYSTLGCTQRCRSMGACPGVQGRRGTLTASCDKRPQVRPQVRRRAHAPVDASTHSGTGIRQQSSSVPRPPPPPPPPPSPPRMTSSRQLYAPRTFSTPPPTTEPGQNVLTVLSLLLYRQLVTWALVALTNALRSKSAAPMTCGAAADVPAVIVACKGVA